MIICDTGPMVAAANSEDDRHRACTDLFTGLHLAGRQILGPGPVVAEVGYLLQRKKSISAEAGFLRSLAEGAPTPIDLRRADFARMVDLVETYSDFPLGTTDAAVIALAETSRHPRDRHRRPRHFRAVRPRHVPAFTLLP